MLAWEPDIKISLKCYFFSHYMTHIHKLLVSRITIYYIVVYSIHYITSARFSSSSSLRRQWNSVERTTRPPVGVRLSLNEDGLEVRRALNPQAVGGISVYHQVRGVVAIINTDWPAESNWIKVGVDKSTKAQSNA